MLLCYVIQIDWKPFAVTVLRAYICNNCNPSKFVFGFVTLEQLYMAINSM